MAQQSRSSLAALQAQQSALAGRHSTAADADRVLAEVLASAHTLTRDSIRRLDTIADEIDRAALARADFASDTSVGARELQKFLVVKLREITAVIADADEVVRAKKVVLESLRAQYVVSEG